MRRRDLIRAVLTTPLAGWLQSWAPRSFALAEEPAPNAATIYRTAFAWAKGLRPDDHARLRGAATISLEDRAVRTLMEQAGPTLRALREGAAMAECRWEVEILSVADLNQGHLDVFGNDAIRVACLSARRLARAGRGREALDDLFAGLTLAHRIGTGGVLMARVIEGAGEVIVFQTLGRLLPAFDLATRDDLSARLDALPDPEPASATIDGPEARFIVASLRAKVEAAGPTLRDQNWEDLGWDQEGAASVRKLVGDDRAALLAHLDATGPAFADLARCIDLPWPRSGAALDEFARTRQATDPIVVSYVKTARTARHVVDQMRARRPMIRAGIALVQGGEPVFRAIDDPFGDGPHGLERRGNGDLIRSALVVDEGRPEVALAIGDAS